VSPPGQRSRRQRDLFLCHSGRDKVDVVLPLAQRLAARKVTFWLDEAEIGLGDSITQKIGEGLANARYVVAFISRSFLRRNWPQQELRAGLASSLAGGPARVLPLLVGLRTATFFRHYPLLSDLKCGSTRDGIDRLADELSRLVGKLPSTRGRTAPVAEITLHDLPETGLFGTGRPLWLRLSGAPREPRAESVAGYSSIADLLRRQGVPLHVGWDREASAVKRYTAGVLLSLILAYDARAVDGFDSSLRKRRGVFIHSFSRPAYSTKDPEGLSIKAASGAVLDEEVIALLNAPAFFPAGWRDRISIAPIVLGRKGILPRNPGLGEGFFTKMGDNPWVPHSIDPLLVVVPYSRLSSKLRRLLQRYKYAPTFPRAAICSAASTVSDAELLTNNGFVVIDRVSDASQLLSVCRALVSAARRSQSAVEPEG